MKYKRLLTLILSVILIITALPFSVYAKSSAPSKPTSLSATSTTSSVSLKWKKVKSASGYTVYSYNSKTKKYKSLKTLGKNSYKITKLTSGTNYTYAVKAYKTVKKKKVFSAYSSKLTVSTLPDKVKNFKVLGRNASSVSFSWSKVKNAQGYKINYSTDKTFKKSVKSKTASANKVSVSVASDKKYYFRISAYRKVGGRYYYSASSSVISPSVINSANVSTINAAKTYQTMEGFGASACWWGHKVGGWENAKDIIKYLYSPKEGIGLNIYRYNVGTGSRSDDKMWNYWARTDGFLTDVDFTTNKLTYDFSRDAEAQNSLKIAKEYAGDDLKLCLFSNSPPVQLTKNGKAYCSNNEVFNEETQQYENWGYWYYKSNLDEKNYKLYAQFECDVADYFLSQGYNVFDVSPVNEPQFEWACNREGYMNQEGCHYKPYELRKLYNEMAKKGYGKPYKFSMFEGGAAEGIDDNGNNTYFVDYVNEIFNDLLNKRYYNSISCHSYWANAHGKEQCRNYVDSIDTSLNIACTEYCQMYNDVNTGVYETCQNLQGEALNGYTIDFGVQMARIINEDLTILNANQWNWWTGVSNGIYPDGLVYINDSNHADIKLTKRLWCLGQYSKFIKEGAKRVDINCAQKDLLSSAFVNPDSSLVIVYVNQTKSNKTANINAQGYSQFKLYQTTAQDDLKLKKSGNFYMSEGLVIPAQSVVSVILTK
ncbi:MAG: fibronectin type III domain-containing protein [Eubacterium sp.]|nr:fibronectin type III domain-containing protein [Eubacterium sp.]